MIAKQFQVTHNGRSFKIVYHHEIGWITERPFFTDTEIGVVGASEILSIHPESVRRLIRNGRIPAHKIGTKWMMRETVVREMAVWYTGKCGRNKRAQTRMVFGSDTITDPIID